MSLYLRLDNEKKLLLPLKQNLSPGLVETDMTSAHIPPDPTEYMHVQDIANACLSILNTPPNVVVNIIFFNSQAE